MAAAVLFPPRYALGDDDDAPASSSRFRARLNPWRPAPLFIPDADEEDPAERTNASGSCTDELQSVEREIAGYAAARAQVARELALAREQVHQFSRAAAAPGGADAGVTPESTRACGATPHRVEAGAEAGTRAERSDGRARAAGGLRGASRSERERLLDAELQACFGVPPPETPMSSRGVLSARPGSARLDLNFDDGCDDGEGVEGGVGGGWWHGTCPSRRPSFFPDGGYDSGQDEDQHGVGEAPEDAVTPTHWTPPPQRRLRPRKLELHLDANAGWRGLAEGGAAGGRGHALEDDDEEGRGWYGGGGEGCVEGGGWRGEGVRGIAEERYRPATEEVAAASADEAEAEAEAEEDAEAEVEEVLWHRQRDEQQVSQWKEARDVEDADECDEGDADECQRLLQPPAMEGAPLQCSGVTASPRTCSLPRSTRCLPMHSRLAAGLRRWISIRWVPSVIFAALVVLLQVALVT